MVLFIKRKNKSKSNRTNDGQQINGDFFFCFVLFQKKKIIYFCTNEWQRTENDNSKYLNVILIRIYPNLDCSVNLFIFKDDRLNMHKICMIIIAKIVWQKYRLKNSVIFFCLFDKNGNS